MLSAVMLSDVAPIFYHCYRLFTIVLSVGILSVVMLNVAAHDVNK
jgi:hypothetical protein